MTEFLVAKWLHVLSSTVLFGTGIGSAFYMLVASRSRDPHAAHFVVRWVVVADWIFTSTTIIVQPATGLWLAHLAGHSLSSPWLAGSIALYVFAGACWLPVVWMQVHMRDMAKAAVEAGTPLPEAYFRYLRRWIALGIPAFLALAVIFFLMVAKPS